MSYKHQLAQEKFGEPWEALIARLYQEEKLSLSQIAEITGLSTTSIWADLRKQGIPLRPQGGPNNPDGNKSKTEFRGRKQTLFQWAREYGLNPVTVYARVYQYQWPLQRALETPVFTSARFTFAGHTLTLKAWSRRTGIAYETLRSRLNWGWSFERAITEPIDVRRRRRAQR